MSERTANPPSAPSSSSPPRRYITDLRPNERFGGTFSIANAQLAVTKNGDPYLACLLGDKTGSCPARRWQMPPEEFKQLPTNGFVYAEGRTQPFKGELQLILDHIQGVDPKPEDLRELLPSAERDPADMFADVTQLLSTLEHPAMKALVEVYLDDEMLMDRFRQAPAAKMMHHAYIGGLLDHTLTLMRLADVVCPMYPRINRDLVMVGLFLHDLGKTHELSWEGAFEYTDRGELIGHIVEGAIMLHDKAQQVIRTKGVRLPPGALSVLQHIILSHHTEPEYGAARRPATPEAILVALLDNLDAKTIIGLDAARPKKERAFDLGGNFTEKQWALQTKVYRPDPLNKS